VAQTLLKAGEHRLVVAGFEIDDAIGFQARLGERRREQVGPRDAPQDFAARPGRNAGRKQRSGRAVDRAIAAASDLMQSTKRESTPRQMSVDFLDAERQHSPPARARALDAPNALSKLLDNRGRGGRTHVLCNSQEN
jgi:hypothetical protein